MMVSHFEFDWVEIYQGASFPETSQFDLEK